MLLRERRDSTEMGRATEDREAFLGGGGAGGKAWKSHLWEVCSQRFLRQRVLCVARREGFDWDRTTAAVG